MFENDISEDGFPYEKRQREIMLEEIKGLFISMGLGGNSKESKEETLRILENVFATRSWTRLEGMNSNELRRGFAAIKKMADEKCHAQLRE